MVRTIITFFLIIGSALGLFLFLKSGRTIDLTQPIAGLNTSIEKVEKPVEQVVLSADGDIPNQVKLANPPKEIKAIYLTNWSASSDEKISESIKLIRDTELNAVIIDIKDYSGIIGYNIQNDNVLKYNARELRIRHLNKLIKRFHDEGIYLIGRITVFQDPILAKNRPDLAVKSKSTGGVWLDNKKLAWMDASSKDVWDYNISIAKDVLTRGFDEVNFDYIRFPSDGKISDMQFSNWDGVEDKHMVLKRFFEYLRNNLSGSIISADLFGMATFANDDLGIGQIIEDAYEFFDYVCPMVYPSHYAKGFNGYKNPADYPYEVVKYSMEIGLKKLNDVNAKITEENKNNPGLNKKLFTAKLRPWLQDFDLGADYDAKKVRAQIDAVYDSGLNDGWLLWDPRNVYTKGALKIEE